MQPVTLLSAAAAMVATVSANMNFAEYSKSTASQLNAAFDSSLPYARVVNRCKYPVYAWHVFKGMGCPSDEAIVLQPGDSYQENYPPDSDTSTGVSVKLSKESTCKGSGITQLEFYLETHKPGFNFNYLDVSYVDCEDGKCPGRQDGYFLQAGNQIDKAATASAGNTWCPVLSCSDSASCDKMSYVDPDDVQTKTCDLKSNIDFYLCGSEPGSDNGSTPSKPASSPPKAASSAAPKQTTTLAKIVSTPVQKVQVAEVTKAPLVDTKNIPRVKTEVVIVTAYQTMAAKRHEHAHAHARRHQPFNA